MITQQLYKRLTCLAVFFLGFGLTSIGQAQPLAIPKFVAGEHYQVLPNPVTVAPADKIEVMEVFWYGCSHCLSFEPLVAAWKKTQADDVAFLRTPAVWQKKMRSHAALYYVAEHLDLPNDIHTDLFRLLVANRQLDDAKAFAKEFAKHGVSAEDFDKAYNSFGIKSKINQAEKRLRKNYLVQGTPEMIVNGKYRVSARMVGGQSEMLAVVDFLVGLERKE